MRVGLRWSGVATASLGVWVGAGSRHERPDESGLSHLIEHMAFKGTARRSARDIAEEIENVGGEINAEIEHQTAIDTTTGTPLPMGLRRARMADTLGAAA